MPSFIQTVACNDQPNLIKQTCTFISSNQGNILEMEQYVDQAEGIFFLRVSWETNLAITSEQVLHHYKHHMQIDMLSCNCYLKQDKIRMAVLVSKNDHCLFDIIMRYHNHEWPAVIPCVISNHPDLGELCEKFSIPFKYIPINDDKLKQEKKVLATLHENNIELVVLARYMQILTGNFVNAYANNIINIHHSFLPAFVGAKPYHQAFEKGVKMIGATSHYVTEDLDQGPIIAQDIKMVNHSHTIGDLIHMGKDVEKKVLYHAIKAHLERKVLVFNNKTIVFR